MNYVVFNLIMLIIKCDAGVLDTTVPPEPLTTSLSSSDPSNVVYYTAVINKPLDLPFQDVRIMIGRCDDYYDHGGVLKATINNSMIHVSNVTHSMSTLWKCKVVEGRTARSYENNLTLYKKTLYLNLHVKGAKTVEITVNGNELTFSEAEPSAPSDGNTIYFYKDGEHVRIVCRNLHSTGSVHLEYFTRDSFIISDSAKFFIQLHLGSNSSYIDCVYNTTKPADTYVYRVIFVTKKRLLDLNESKFLSNVKKPATSSSLILGSSIAVVLVILGLSGVACWYLRTRKTKHIETPYGDLSNQNDNPVPQSTNEGENQYDACHYSENISNRETYETPGSVENNMDPEDHYYTKIDYSRCNPKIDETQTRNSKVYDEPYVHITMSERKQPLQALQRV